MTIHLSLSACAALAGHCLQGSDEDHVMHENLLVPPFFAMISSLHCGAASSEGLGPLGDDGSYWYGNWTGGLPTVCGE